MPCTYDESIGQRDRELSKVTRMLCELCSLIERCDNTELSDFLFNGELTTWWSRHKEFDAKRKAEERRIRKEERARKVALSKLTSTEKKMLGL